MTKWSASTGRLRGFARPEPLVAALLVGPTVGFAACGGASGPGAASLGASTTTSPGSASQPPAAVAADYAEAIKCAQCVRTHGVPNFPDPISAAPFIFAKGGPNNQTSQPEDEPGYTGANKVCGRLLPNGGPPTAAQMECIGSELLKFSECMRSHGVADFPIRPFRAISSAFGT